MNKINVNEYVWVKLTEYGKYKVSEYSRICNMNFGKKVMEEMPWKLEDGYCKVQFWEFMKILGDCFSMGLQTPIENNEIYFEKPKNKMIRIPDGDYCTWCNCCEYNERFTTHFCWKYKEKLSTENFGIASEARKCLSCVSEGRKDERNHS